MCNLCRWWLHLWLFCQYVPSKLCIKSSILIYPFFLEQTILGYCRNFTRKWRFFIGTQNNYRKSWESKINVWKYPDCHPLTEVGLMSQPRWYICVHSDQIMFATRLNVTDKICNQFSIIPWCNQLGSSTLLKH